MTARHAARRRVRGRFFASAAALVALATVPSGPALARPSFPERAATAYDLASKAFDAQDCTAVLRQVGPIVGDRDFATLSERGRTPFLILAGLCEVRSGQLEQGLAHVRTATETADAPAVAWTLRLGIEMDANHDEAAVTTLEAMKRQAPAALAEIEPEWLYHLLRRLRTAPARIAARDRLAALASAPDFPVGRYDPEFDAFRLENARRLVRAGDRAGAIAQIAAIRNHTMLIEASLDPVTRFAVPADLDLKAATRAEIAHLAALGKERPGLLALVIAEAEAHRAVGEPEKALALLESARPEGSLAPQFSDRASQLNWWWNEMAYTYAQLGRYDDAVAAMKSAMAVGERGEFNVSQLLNLAGLQVRFGHPDQALQTLAPQVEALDGRSSPYGRMVFRLSRGCAAHRAGQAGLAAGDLAYMAAHRADAPANLTAMMLCMGDIDGAAAATVARLDDPETRTDALTDLSTYADWPATVPADPDHSAYERLLAHPDVKAAIERAGGVRRFNILPRSI